MTGLRQSFTRGAILGANQLTLLAAAGVWAAIAAYAQASRGLEWGCLVVGLPLFALVIVRRRGDGLLLAIGVTILIPNWYSHVWLIAPAAATLGLACGVARTRLRGVDVAFVVLVGVLSASWLTHPALRVPTRTFVEDMMPLGLYVWVRLTLTESMLRRTSWIIFIAAGVAACSVLIEAAHGSVLFSDPNFYEWNGGQSALFRPGGVFGGAPIASIGLASLLLSSLVLYREHRRLALIVFGVMLTAIVATLGRAGIIGLGAGIIAFGLLLPYRHWARVMLVVLATSIPVYALATSSTVGQITQTKLFQEGVLRPTARISLLSEATPLIADSPSHLLFGRGFDSLQATSGVHDEGMATVPYIWLQSGGPNDDYIRALLEQGLLGLVAQLSWLVGSAYLGVRTCMRLEPSSKRRMWVAGLTAGTIAYIVGSTGHDLFHNRLSIALASLITGLVVSTCTLSSRGAELMEE